MIKTALASAAVLGAVMVAPAQATVPAPVTNNILGQTFASAAGLLATFSMAWAPYFDLTAPGVTYNAIFAPNVLTAVYSDGLNVRTFVATSSTFFGPMTGNYQMPVPGPIAGAGLPLLAAGIAFAAWRRRRAANAA